MLVERRAESLDEILCDPDLADEFDQRASRFVPGLGSFECRWAALKLRKAARAARHRGKVLKAPKRKGQPLPIDDFHPDSMQEKSGVYIVSDINEKTPRLYIGGTLNLREQLRRQFGGKQREAWSRICPTLGLQGFAVDARPGELLAWQSCLAQEYQPRLNFRELWQAS